MDVLSISAVAGSATAVDEKTCVTLELPSGPQSRQSGLKTYNADGGVQQFGFTAVGSYNATESIRVDLIGRYQRLGGDAADSPLVDGTSNSRGDANQFIFGVIGAYTF